MANQVLKLDPRDTVLIALTDLQRGAQISFDSQTYTLESDVPAKHKFAAEDLPIGASVKMYGVIVGKALEPIRRGGLLTTRNIHHQAAAFHEKTGEFHWAPPDVSKWQQRRFFGYRRDDGQVGSRNYWIVVPLVFCENRNISVLKQALEEELGFAAPQVYRRQVAELARLYQRGQTEEIKTRTLTGDLPSPPRSRIFEHVDGLRFLLHEGGCGGTREDSNNLCGLIAGYINHPNVAGATVLSLGCQHAQVGILRRELLERNPNFDKPLVIVEQQQSGTEAAMLTEAIQDTFLGLMKANECQRTNAPLSSLCLGLKCGGSDGFSGLYANQPGLNLQCTPGNDVECVTAQVGAGASVVLFTTGLGTPTGNPIAPVVKLSTNSALAQRMADIIDIDTGGIISGEKTIEQMGEEVLDFGNQVASGEIRTKAEGKGQEDFIPWKRGISL